MEQWNKENGYRYKIFDYDTISPTAQDKIPDKSTIGLGDFELDNNYRLYPFKCMRIGQAFYVLYSEKVLRHTLESCHRGFTKSHEGRYFRVIWHKQQQCFEVVRIK